jgi:hypothetical protein
VSDEKKVVPIRPIPGLAGMHKIEEVYTTPAAAIHAVLDSKDFNEKAIGKGWVQLNIVAKFSETGAMFHTINMSQVMMEDPLQTPLADALIATKQDRCNHQWASLESNEGVSCDKCGLTMGSKAFAEYLRQGPDVHVELPR